jgi:hypothetical protein
VRRHLVILGLLCLAPHIVLAQDPVAEARRLYNAGFFDDAERVIRSALQQPATANTAAIVLGRIQLERFRTSGSSEHLSEARTALRNVDALSLDARERIELTLGFAETLFFEDRFAASAAMFEPVLEASIMLGPIPHGRVLDWWASALDRYAQTRPIAERTPIYDRIAARMAAELQREPGTGAASYWLVAAARGRGDLEAAWTAAIAAWVRATLCPDRGAALRGDLDRLMLQAIIPERAARIAPRDPANTVAGLTGEWETFKAGWAKGDKETLKFEG